MLHKFLKELPLIFILSIFWAGLQWFHQGDDTGFIGMGLFLIYLNTSRLHTRINELFDED